MTLPKRPKGVGSGAQYDRTRGLWVSGSYWFDEKAADAAVDFFPRYLRLTSGEWAGRPFVLEDWQADDIVRPLFGWKRPDGTRRYRRCYIWVPRKNGKTELAAGIALLMLLGDGEEGGEVYSIAADGDQAAIVFNKATAMVGKSEALSNELTCLKTAIYCGALNASFKPLSGSGKGKHGKAASGLIGDEIHEWPSGELYQFMHDSEGNRRQPLEFLISTAGKKGGYGSEVYDECEKICDGVLDDPETLVVIYAADPDHDDWTQESTWYKANPNLGVSKKLETMRSDARRAMQSPRLENSFKAYHLNIWSEQAVRWLPIDMADDTGRRFGWKYCAGPHGWQDLETLLIGKRCFSGIDLSSINDLTALLHWFPVQDGLQTPAVVARFFKPEDLIGEHSKRDKLPYDRWVGAGAIIATPGNVVDYAFLKKTLFDDAERFEIQNIGVDRYNATQTTIEIAQEGLPIEYFQQGFISMSPPSKELERLVMSNALHHGGHPVLDRHAKVVAVETDPAGNIKPTKAKSAQRIDGIVALVNAIGVASRDQGDAGKLTSERILERGGLL
ncbi:terminase large subunit [Pararhodobacter zhoushanensis]|uniref:Terminase large subunit n=1 Tax=Pararhodobacter zhoushanensis TaxID=2479545 RepID=A0ABT3GYI7_9RHOB|nr:terminase TerL endonuclease subunit [Pararhodobacter zhoushanensis]MCW1932624.1 terminase large subunit [Pararhodobacter zhoushanensis]